MGRRLTPPTGIVVRFFRVRYTRAQRDAHFRVIEDLMNAQFRDPNAPYVETLSAYPLDADDGEGLEGGLEAAFLIEERATDAYLAQIPRD